MGSGKKIQAILCKYIFSSKWEICWIKFVIYDFAIVLVVACLKGNKNLELMFTIFVETNKCFKMAYYNGRVLNKLYFYV